MHGHDINRRGRCWSRRGPAGCSAGAFQTSTPTSSAPHGGTSTEGGQGPPRLPSHTLAHCQELVGFLLLELRIHRAPGAGGKHLPPFMDSISWSPLLFLACGRGANCKWTASRLAAASRGPHPAQSPARDILQFTPPAYVKPDGLLCARHHIMLAPGLSTARAEKGTWAVGWRPKPKGTTEKPGLWFRAHGGVRLPGGSERASQSREL